MAAQGIIDKKGHKRDICPFLTTICPGQEINIVGGAREVKGHLFEILVQPRALYKKGT